MPCSQGQDGINGLPMCQAHNRRDESVASFAVKAESCRWRDAVQFPLKKVFRAMKPCLDGSFA
jgi:hypothetical protein